LERIAASADKMGLSQARRLLQGSGKGKELVSRVRPVTLLTACGILLTETRAAA
jgi:hypothetical protein